MERAHRRYQSHGGTQPSPRPPHVGLAASDIHDCRVPNASMRRPHTLSGKFAVDLLHLASPENAVGQLWMGQDQARCLDVSVTETHDVEIERPRSPPDGADPPIGTLDLVQPPQQLDRFERRFQRHHSD